MSRKINVATARSYTVSVGADVLGFSGEYVASLTKAEQIALISDDTVAKLYAQTVRESLENKGFRVSEFVFPHGEGSKTPKTYLEIVDFLSRSQLTRGDAVVALGGGVVGDIAGFSAATYLRGIDYIQMPTTLLSAVDSSVGGKCAVDLPMGKNLLGAFHQPLGVLCDIKCLDTLPSEYFADGCGEVLKYGILYSPELFSHIAQNGTAFDREYVISKCVALKAGVVARDEKDLGERALLNLGHTVGHAIETLSGMKISHGAAVATGCAVIARACAADGICSQTISENICRSVLSLGHRDKCDYSADELLRVMISDKKRRGDFIDFIVIEDIGKCGIRRISVDAAKEFIAAGL